ncbi:Phosphoinositide 3-phosphatase [Hypsizygus marmoreus]|uniref:Phosphoinositide 3-phosphatase n=1 Tax=Hypsizygus marmoreus TaxID=39966 RepID=A0A369JRG0_HYPMA|nr:Phosphoinositide 3-phosphatase [Hypsizygus marmoreus]
MDAIRVSKVERVACTKSGTTKQGTIHLTAHHLIFRYDGEAEKEMWVPYPIISLVSCLPQTLQGLCPVTFHTRTFETFSLAFSKENEATDVFESVKELTVATSVTQLYAFFYRPNPPFPTSDGWSIYSPRDEFGRMGVGSRSKSWRFTDINKDYSFCPTYPARLVVPTRISDTTLRYASKYRSKCRIPVLTYLHWANYGSITRSSQPMVGITQNRSIQDEKLIEAVFQSHSSPDSRASNAPVYGATTTNLIIDARPTTNAMANTAKGAGTENMDHYKDGKKAYLGIDHIHTMRESLGKVVEALREADSLLASINSELPDKIPGLAVLDRQALRRSGWLRHLSAILEGTVLITKNVHINSSHVLIHCSDGWDRTSQLSALSQLCLDPFYRTIRGFEILVEKDWLSYGHKFLDRCGHLSSDKFFLSSSETASADATQAFITSVQNRFTSQQHIKETSPVFHQFLESVRQVQRQFPERFEFNERFLRQLYYHLYSCQFGTFLYNCERERRVGDGGPPPCDRTISVWDFFNSPAEMEQNRNPLYDASLDDPASREPGADMGVLFPNSKDVRFWHELYGRTDEEMNGRPFVAQARGVEVTGSIEDVEEDSVVFISDSPSATSLPSLTPSKSPPLLSRSYQPLKTRPERSKSTSFYSGDASRDLSTSTPEMASRPGSARPDSNVPLASSSPDVAQRQPRTPSPNPAFTPNRARTKPPDFLSSSGVKSVWGKLSSNASAALSVVQDAYVGVSKDLRSPGGAESQVPGKTAELRGRETLSAWGERRSPSPSASSSISRGLGSLSLTTSNPWASSSPSGGSRMSALEENPWGSVRSSALTQTAPREEPYQMSSSPLPLDPTVAHPTPRAASTLFPAAGMRAPPPARKETSDLIPPTNTTPASSSAADPLGVGLL